MSVQLFFSSDKPLKPVDDTQTEIISIEEAEGRGILMPNWYSKDMGIDRTKKIVLFAPNEECLHEIQITTDNTSVYAKAFSSKRYHSMLQFGYSDKRAKSLISYMAEHLAIASEIALWCIWLDQYGVPKVKRRGIAALSIADIKEISEYDPYETPYCLLVGK